jgi:hypothetical protein
MEVHIHVCCFVLRNEGRWRLVRIQSDEGDTQNRRFFGICPLSDIRKDSDVM